jgi:hypothetical protein
MDNPKIEIPDKVLEEAYQDVVHPAAKEVGKTLGGTVRVALAPFNALIWGFDKISVWVESEVTKKLSGIPSDKIKTPDPLIAGPLIENMRFSEQHEEMRRMYASLLAHSMVEGEEKKILPSFVDIVKQLSPLDVLILNYLEQNGGAGRIVDIRANKMISKPMKFAESFQTLFSNYLPQSFTGYTETDVAVAVNDLERLDIVMIPEGYCISCSYEDIKQTTFYLSFSGDPRLRQENTELDIQKKKIEITTFGAQFLSCVE